MNYCESIFSRNQCAARLALIGFIIAWITLEIAIAQGTLKEHSQEITAAQWYIIVALMGIVQTLIAFIYLSGQKNITRSIEKINDDLENREKLLLSTRAILLELRGEHKVMMDRCHKVQTQSHDMTDEEDRND